MPENRVFAAVISFVQKNNVDFNVVCWMFSGLANDVVCRQGIGVLWAGSLCLSVYSWAKRLFT